MCENSLNHFVQEPTFGMVDEVQTNLKSVRTTGRAAVEEPNIEEKFRQELNNPSVREHDPAIVREQSLTDRLIEDTTGRLNVIQQENTLLHEDLEMAKKALDEKRLENIRLGFKIEELSGRLLRLRRMANRAVMAERDMRVENYRLKNRFTARLGRWLKRQWNYDIYHPSR